MVKKSQRIWIIFVGLFIALVAAFAVPKTEDKEVHAVADVTISTVEDLEEFRNNINYGSTYYGQTIELSADLNLSGISNWEPIGYGYNNHRFAGTFNGNGHTISGMKINITHTSNSNYSYVGFFGEISDGAKIQNLGIINASVTVSSSEDVFAYTGGLVGYSSYSTITNCYVTGSVTTTGASRFQTGGLVGCNYYSNTISNCYATGSVTVTASGQEAYAGGLVGYQQAGNINNSYATNNITIGTNASNKYVGKLIGQQYASGTSSNLYYLSTSTLTINNSSGNCTNNTSSLSGATSKTTSQFSSGEVAYLLNGSTSTGNLSWYQSIDNDLSPHDSYPVLNSERGTVYYGYTCNSSTTSYSNKHRHSTANQNHDFEDNNGFCAYCDAYEAPSNGTGTSESPYEITNAGQLYWFAAVVNDYDRNKCQGSPSVNSAACAKLMNHITINTDVSSSSARLWNPIGRYIGNDNRRFTGSIDGNKHTISGMKINMNNTSWTSAYVYAGLVGYAAPTIKDLTVENARINVVNNSGTATQGFAGVFAGNAGGTYTNCKAKDSTVTLNNNENNFSGGFIGIAVENSTFTNCSTENCTVTANTSDINLKAGGFAGLARTNTTVTNCSSSGSVTATSTGSGVVYVGGFVGESNSNIARCYSNNSVTVTRGNSATDVRVGGFVGYYNSSSSTVTDSYSNSNVIVTDNCTGTSTGYTLNVGGFVGGTGDHSISNCYATGNVTMGGTTGGYSSCAGGFVGRQGGAGSISKSYATGTVVGQNKRYLNVGGFAGSQGNDGTVQLNNCYATGSASATGSNVQNIAGGLVGIQETSSNAITNSYATGDVTISRTGETYDAGRLIGYKRGTTVTSTYTLNTSKINGTAGAAKIGSYSYDSTTKTAAQFASGEVTCLLNSDTGASYASGGEIWRQNLSAPVDSYPVLDDTHNKVYTDLMCGSSTRYYTNDCSYTDGHSFDNGFCTSCGKYQGCAGEGTSDSPYQISNAGQLYWFACIINTDTNNKCIMYPGNNTSACGKLTTNITIPEKDPSDNTDLLWTPIGKEGNSFQGTFDGNNKTISGMNVNITGATISGYAGLFGYVYGSKIQNVGLENFSVNASGSRYVYAGGLVGYLNGSSNTITGSYATGDVTATSIDAGYVYAGGLAGYNDSVTITNSYATGDVSVTTDGTSNVRAGGLVGYLTGSSSTITNSYAIGDVSVTDDSGSNVRAGGLIGDQSNNSSAYNGYSISNITVSGSGTGAKYVGKVIGRQSSGISTNLYYLDSSTITNNTTAGTYTDNTSTLSGATSKTKAEFASGEVTCWLNGGDGTSKSSGGTPWYQSIDNGMAPDAYPLLDSSRGRVYVSTPCGQSSPEYSNYNRGSATTHSFNSSGFCTKCGAYQPCTGAGTSASPYQIGNAGQLYWFACVVNDDHLNCEDYYATNSRKTNAYGTLTANITIPSERLWKPIGKSNNGSDYYKGTFDGNNKTISGMKVDITGATGYVYAGFFGYLSSYSTVQNLGIENIDINFSNTNTNQNHYVGGLAGFGYADNVRGCHVTGNINIHNDGTTGYYYSGGLFGYKEGTLNDCYVDANIVVDSTASYNSYAGGLIGYNNTGDINRCYTKGTISAKARYTGGLVGYAYGNTCINNCYSMVDVTSTYTANSAYTGGLVGCLYFINAGYVLSNSYSIGDVSASSSTKYVGRLVGINSNGTVTNCYYLSTSALPSDGTITVCNEGTSKTAAQFASGEETYLLNQGQGIAWYQSLDNNLSPHDSYPLLDSSRGIVYKGCTPSASSTSDVYYSNSPDTTHTFDSNGFCQYCGAYQACTGEGTSASPYQIGNAGQLYWFAAVVNNELDKCENPPAQRNTNAYGTLTDDIVINEDISSASARLWMPIGINNSTSNYYTGTFDGDGHTISGMKVDITGATSAIYAGLFGYIGATAKIQNVGLENFSVNASGLNYVYAGGLAGYNNSATITNSYATGDVTATSTVVSNAVYAGGLVGYLYGSSSTITGSYATGDVTVTSTGSAVYVGGLAGYNNSATITNSYAIGDVSVTNDGTGYVRAGGLIGYQNSANSSVYNGYSISNITVSGSGTGAKYVGKVIGQKNSGTSTNLYYLSTSTITNNTTAGTYTDNTSTLSGATSKTTSQFSSGEVAYLLNGSTSTGNLSWYQSIDNDLSPHDSYPVLNSERGTVYYGYTCNSSTISYSNKHRHSTANQNHDFEDNNGFCSYCDAYEAPSNGTGTSESPYEITNAGQLYWFAAVVNDYDRNKCQDSPSVNSAACAKLMNDITINTDVSSSSARLWNPIGRYIGNDNRRFTGSIDGNNHTISGMRINMSNTSWTQSAYVYAGLVGYAVPTIKDLTVENARINVVNNSGTATRGFAGVFAGNAEGTYTNCKAKDSTVTLNNNSNNFAGGFIGLTATSTFTNCSTENCTVTANTSARDLNAGGFAGSISNSTVTNCSSSGSVTVTSTSSYAVYAGGLVGLLGGSSSTITNSYAIGDVSVTNDGTGNVMAGGLIGYQNTNNSAYNGYSISNITVSGSGTGAKYVGKVIGQQNSGTATNLYYLDSSTITNNTTAGTYTDNTSTLSGATSKTATEFSNFAVKDLLQTYVDANTTVSNPLSSWVQAVDKPEFSWDNHELSTTLSWGNMTFAYDPEEGTWALPEGDEGENIVTFVNGSNGAKLRYNAVFDISSQLSGITGGIAHSSGDVTYQGATWPMVNSSDMTVSTNSRNTTLTISGTPSGGNFDRTTPESPMEIGVITMTISG